MGRDAWAVSRAPVLLPSHRSTTVAAWPAPFRPTGGRRPPRCERTIRNRISAGKLPAEQIPEGFRVLPEDLVGKVPLSAEARSETSGKGGDGATISALVHLVVKLPADVVSKAAAAAMWQARAEMPAAQLEHAQALPAPQPAQDAPRGESDAHRPTELDADTGAPPTLLDVVARLMPALTAEELAVLAAWFETVALVRWLAKRIAPPAVQAAAQVDELVERQEPAF